MPPWKGSIAHGATEVYTSGTIFSIARRLILSPASWAKLVRKLLIVFRLAMELIRNKESPSTPPKRKRLPAKAARSNPNDIIYIDGDSDVECPAIDNITSSGNPTPKAVKRLRKKVR